MYCYFSLEYYDQENGIRGGGGLGVLAADTRRVAERAGVKFATVTPFYPIESHQVLRGGEYADEKRAVDFHDFGYKNDDYVFVKCNGGLARLEILRKDLGSTAIIAVTEPNFGELYQGLSGSDHRLYQEVALGFGGYKALKLYNFRPKYLQLNEVATVFAAIARLDDLISGGLDFYEAMATLRKHTLYTNHTLVQAAEAEFSLDQFERFVFPNIESRQIVRWLREFFVEGRVRLSKLAFELAGKRNGVSRLHAAVANYCDATGEKVHFQAITNGIDIFKWILPETLTFYEKCGIIRSNRVILPNLKNTVTGVTAEKIRELKRAGREVLNTVLQDYPDQEGRILNFGAEDLVFTFKRRLVDYKRPELAFTDPAKLREVLEGARRPNAAGTDGGEASAGAHYIIAGRVHAGDAAMSEKLSGILETVRKDDFLRNHVHYLADYDEKLAYGLSVGSNIAINTPRVGLEACGTSWMKDVGNLNLLISTPDGGVADKDPEYYLSIESTNEAESLYQRMKEAAEIWQNDFELEFTIEKQLAGYLPVISGERMLKEYLDFLGRT